MGSRRSERRRPVISDTGNSDSAKPNLVFGRGDEVDVDLDDPAVSRRHAMIEARPDGFRLVDLKSKSGSFVNGRRFVDHELVIGDQIQFGPFLFTYDGRNLHRVRWIAWAESLPPI